jgi:upstream activation factor subunit UAF30
MNSYRNRILEILQNSDLQKVTPKSIRLQLEQEFNVDLSQDKSELKTLIFQLLDSLSGNSTDALENNTVLENKSTLENNSALENDTVSKDSSTVSEESKVSQEQTKRKTGFHKEYYLSKELSVLLNKQTCSRPEVTREIWDYIKARNLQDTKDKRYILTDDLLFTVLKKKRMHMFEMTKVVSTHIKEAVEQEESQDTSRIKKKKLSRKSTSVRKSTSGKSNSGKKGGWNKEYKLSKELAMVLNTEKESRPQIVKKLWEYIKSLDLQDPKDKRFIKTDELLFKVFKIKRLNGFKVNFIYSKLDEFVFK